MRSFIRVTSFTNVLKNAVSQTKHSHQLFQADESTLASSNPALDIKLASVLYGSRCLLFTPRSNQHFYVYLQQMRLITPQRKYVAFWPTLKDICGFFFLPLINIMFQNVAPSRGVFFSLKHPAFDTTPTCQVSDAKLKTLFCPPLPLTISSHHCVAPGKTGPGSRACFRFALGTSLGGLSLLILRPLSLWLDPMTEHLFVPEAAECHVGTGLQLHTGLWTPGLF